MYSKYHWQPPTLPVVGPCRGGLTPLGVLLMELDPPIDLLGFEILVDHRCAVVTNGNTSGGRVAFSSRDTGVCVCVCVCVCVGLDDNMVPIIVIQLSSS